MGFETPSPLNWVSQNNYEPTPFFVHPEILSREVADFFHFFFFLGFSGSTSGFLLLWLTVGFIIVINLI